MATANGILKKSELMEFSNPRSTGVKAINFDEGDVLIDVSITDGQREIFLATRHGLSLRFHESEVRTIGRVGRGVIGIRLNAGDKVVGMEILAGEEGAILTLTENGFGKKSAISEYRIGSRGNKGVFTIKTSERNGEVVGLLQLKGDEELMIITQLGKLIRMDLGKLRSIGRVTQGVRLIQLEEGERVVSIAKIVEDDDENGGENGRPLN
jgi:DNA gyrase subunit A